MSTIQEAAQNIAAAAGAAAPNMRADAVPGLFAQELGAKLNADANATGRGIISATLERLASSFPGIAITTNSLSGFGEAREHYLKTGDAASINVGSDMVSQMAVDDAVFERVKNMISTLLTAGRNQNLINAGGSDIHRSVNIQAAEVRYVEVHRMTTGAQLSIASFSMGTESMASNLPERISGQRDQRGGGAASGFAGSVRTASPSFQELIGNSSSWRLEGVLTVQGLSAMNGRKTGFREDVQIAGGTRVASMEAIIQQWSVSAGASGSGLLDYMQLMGLSDPLVLDLGGEGINLTSAEDGVYFDIKGDGSPVRTAFVRGDNALLYLDRNGNGAADDVAELFGDHGGHANGYETLSQYDDNGDEVIDAHDDVFDRLRVWRDFNRDGVTQENESMTLAEAGVASLSLKHDNRKELDIHGNVIADRSSFTRVDGTAGLMAEAWFRTL